MIIRFKVVQEDTRLSAFAQGKFQHRYDKNIVVEPGHLGVMVFDTRRHAEQFIGIARGRELFKIIKVKVYGKARKPKWISAQFNLESVLNFYREHIWLNKLRRHLKMFPPKGTLCYKKVMAIE